MAVLLARVGSVRGGRGRVLGAVLVVLAVVLAIQLPHLFGGGGAPAPVAVGVAPTAAVVAPEQPTAALAVAEEAAPVSAGTGYLDAIAPVAPKDPFVQQISLERPGSSSPTAAEAVPAPADAAAAVPAPRFATIAVNGVEERLAVDGLFPLGQPLFVLVELEPRSARIGLVSEARARGTFATLELGRILTLEDAATGARYRLELLYLGDVPEQTRRFVTGQSLRAVASAN